MAKSAQVQRQKQKTRTRRRPTKKEKGKAAQDVEAEIIYVSSDSEKKSSSSTPHNVSPPKAARKQSHKQTPRGELTGNSQNNDMDIPFHASEDAQNAVVGGLKPRGRGTRCGRGRGRGRGHGRGRGQKNTSGDSRLSWAHDSTQTPAPNEAEGSGAADAMLSKTIGQCTSILYLNVYSRTDLEDILRSQAESAEAGRIQMRPTPLPLPSSYSVLCEPCLRCHRTCFCDNPISPPSRSVLAEKTLRIKCDRR